MDTTEQLKQKINDLVEKGFLFQVERDVLFCHFFTKNILLPYRDVAERLALRQKDVPKHLREGIRRVASQRDGEELLRTFFRTLPETRHKSALFRLLPMRDIMQPEEVTQETITFYLQQLVECGLLTKREYMALIERFFHKTPYRDVGKTFGVGRERASQIYAKALRKIKHPTRKARFIVDYAEKNGLL